MKRILTLSIASLLLLSLPIGTQAQILNRLKKKAQEAAEKKLEEKTAEALQKKAEQMVENSWNSVFGEAAPDSSSAKGFPFKLNSNVKTEDAYHFNTITTMELESVHGDGKSDPPATMLLHFNNNEMYTGTKFVSENMKKENGDLFLIYDFKNSVMLMLMSSDKDRFSFAYDWKHVLDNASDSMDTKPEDVNWDEVNEWHGYSKIGTRNIAGYSCDGYQSQTDKAKTEVWVTRDEDYGIGNMFKANAYSKQLRGKLPDDYPSGMLVEMTSENLENGDKTIMRVTNVQKNANITYNMADYPTMSLAMKQAN